MSIYSTLWSLRFPAGGEDVLCCDWVEVVAQGVPSHIGSPTIGAGYEDGDPYAAFLPPAVRADGDVLRAVVFVVAGSPKGTPRSSQEYVRPLLVLTGAEYAAIPFAALHRRICDALPG